jgi:hypothetical protein
MRNLPMSASESLLDFDHRERLIDLVGLELTLSPALRPFSMAES